MKTIGWQAAALALWGAFIQAADLSSIKARGYLKVGVYGDAPPLR